MYVRASLCLLHMTNQPATEEPIMAMVLLRDLDDRFQADLWTQALEEQGVPHLLRTFEDTAYDGLFISQKGYGRIFVEEDWLERARKIDADLAGKLLVPDMTLAELAARLDHTLLDPMAGPAELENHIEECLAMGAAAACIPPWLTVRAATLLADSQTAVCTVVGFPLGFELGKTKVYEAAALVEAGASEIDVVFNRGLALSGELTAAVDEMDALAKAVDPYTVKVILETSALGPELSARAAGALVDSGVHFLKTGSGFFGPATPNEVGILKAAGAPKLKVKAAGGIKTLDGALALIAAGADRLGASAGWDIYQEARDRWDA
jgi:deoxyribose-phosphate aldolase